MFRKKRNRVVAGFIAIFFAITTYVLAQDASFEVTVDRQTVSLGSSLQLNLTFHGSQGFAAPVLPVIDGFEHRYAGPSSMMSVVNGRVSSSVTHMYKLIPLREGKFVIPGFSFDHEGKTYSSDPITIEVVKGRPSQYSQQQAQQSRQDYASMEDIKDKVFLISKISKKQLYVGESAELSVKLYVTKIAVTDIRYPEVNCDGFSLSGFSQPKQGKEEVSGALYDFVEFSAEIVALTQGEYKIGPTQVSCNMLVKKNIPRGGRDRFFDNFFDNALGGYDKQQINLEALPISVAVLPFPQQGKPYDFDGAVGDYKMGLNVEPRVVKVGDPITLKVVISGNGNFKTVKMPKIDLGDDFKLYDPEMKQDGLSRIFEQVIIPKYKDISEIPKVRFSYFDPEDEQYRVVTAGPTPITVQALPAGEQAKFYDAQKVDDFFPQEETLGRDIIYIKESLGELNKKAEFLYRNGFFIFIHIIPLIAIGILFVFYKEKRRLETDIVYARNLRAPRKAKKNLIYIQGLLDSNNRDKLFDAIFKALQEYLGDKFHLPSASITSAVIVNLKSKGVSKLLLERLKKCFDICDVARYAPSSITREQANDAFVLLEQIIDGFERAQQ